MTDDFRRIADIITRWSSAINVFLVSALLGVLVFFYGNVPREVAELRGEVRFLAFQMAQVKDELRDLNDQMRGIPTLKERVTVLEQRVAAQEKRLDNNEKPFFQRERK